MYFVITYKVTAKVIIHLLKYYRLLIYSGITYEWWFCENNWVAIPHINLKISEQLLYNYFVFIAA